MSKDNGGPAFPIAEDYSESQGRYVQYASDGMSLRDYFAAKAMQASRSRQSQYTSWNDLAKDAYEISDAMLLERDK